MEHPDPAIVFDPHALEDELSMVDICFVIDTTGSMGPYIDEARRHARQTVEKIAAAAKLDLRLAVVEYRDHPPQDMSFVTRVYPFGSGESFNAALDRLYADGGGDTPEAVWDGLVEAGNLQWRPTADHLCFLIGDSPPHGVTSFHGDGFPEGCPCKATAGGIVELFSFKHITLHAHSIAGDPATTEAFKEVAMGTGGECTVVDRPEASTAAYGGTTTSTADLIGATRSYAGTISTTPGMTDASYATSTGTPLDVVTGMRRYAKSRGIDIPKVGPTIDISTDPITGATPTVHFNDDPSGEYTKEP